MSAERLVHFSSQVITEVHSRHTPPGYLKPDGFWVSVEGNDDGWSDWCRDENFDIEKLGNAHEVTLAADANILRIGTVEQLDAFTSDWDQPHEIPHLNRLGDRINWQGVADLYQGIIITPYLYARRLNGNAFWYYGWDCASGCIWDPAAIESIRLVTPVKAVS